MWNMDKLHALVTAKYKEKFGGGQPTKTFDKVMECIDEEFMDSALHETREVADSLSRAADKVQEEANQTIRMLDEKNSSLDKKIAEQKESSRIQNERVAEALEVYKEIVGIQFETPQQTLQNIQNASYFVWALYFKDRDSRVGDAFFSQFSGEKATSVKDESAYKTFDGAVPFESRRRGRSL